MTKEEFVHKVIKSGPATDRLRKEVDTFLKTIAGIINRENPLSLLPNDFLGSSKNTGALGIYPKSKPNSYYGIEWVVVAEKSHKTGGGIRHKG